mgnify:CR=1 FL=1
MIAKAELLTAPTKEMKLSSCGIPNARAPGKRHQNLSLNSNLMILENNSRERW